MMCVITNGYVYAGSDIVTPDGDAPFIILKDAYIIYDTGPWKDKEWKTAEYLGREWRISKHIIESCGDTEKVLPGQASYPAGPGAQCNTSLTQGSIGGSQRAGGEVDWVSAMGNPSGIPQKQPVHGTAGPDLAFGELRVDELEGQRFQELMVNFRMADPLHATDAFQRVQDWIREHYF